ncbi:acetyltransferase [Vibrio parahaemolyticus]
MNELYSKPLVMIGAGGHATVLAEVLQQQPIVAIVSPEKPEALVFEGIKHIQYDDDLVNMWQPEDVLLVNGIGQLPNKHVRRKVAEFYRDLGYQFATVVSPAALVSNSVVLGSGAQVLCGAIIHGETKIGAHSIINTGAIVEHHCQVAEHCHIAPSSTLCGGVSVAKNSHIGASATIIPQISIGEECMVGAGAVVTQNLVERHRVYGPISTIKN